MSLLDFANRSPVDWFIVFEESSSRPWSWRWLKPGYSHVYAIRCDGFNWIKVEPRLGYVDVDILPNPAKDNLFDVVEPGWTDILHITAWREMNRVRVPWVLGALTCVEAVKSLLGIRSPFIITPWQLAKHLRGEAWDPNQRSKSKPRRKESSNDTSSRTFES